MALFIDGKLAVCVWPANSSSRVISCRAVVFLCFFSFIAVFSINGIPACANRKLLTDIVRKEWGFNGYVISDEGAIELIMVGHNYTNTVVDTVAAAVNAGDIIFLLLISTR
jgi:hypothetical protein